MQSLLLLGQPMDKQFKGVPLMAPTATATVPDVLIELKLLLGGNPICEISTVNKANITTSQHPRHCLQKASHEQLEMPTVYLRASYHSHVHVLFT